MTNGDFCIFIDVKQVLPFLFCLVEAKFGRWNVDRNCTLVHFRVWHICWVVLELYTLVIALNCTDFCLIFLSASHKKIVFLANHLLIEDWIQKITFEFQTSYPSEKVCKSDIYLKIVPIFRSVPQFLWLCPDYLLQEVERYDTGAFQCLTWLLPSWALELYTDACQCFYTACFKLKLCNC